MKKSRFLFILFLLTSAGVLILPSCKERNADFPPHSWSDYFYKTSSISPRIISTVFYENDHSVWLGAQGKEGLLLQDGYKWNTLDKTNTGIDFDSITALIRDGNGKLWVGWKGGLANFNGISWQKDDNFDGLTVSSIVVQGIADIIVGIKGKNGGIAIRRDEAWTFYTPSNSGITSQMVAAMASDHEQALWIATFDKGILKYKNGIWENMSSSIPLLSQNIRCILTATDGSIWAASEASQLVHFHDDTFTIYNTGTSKPVTALVNADDNSIWIGTSGSGLVKFDGAVWTSYTSDNAALPSNEILSLVKGTPGFLFFSIPTGKVLMIKQ